MSSYLQAAAPVDASATVRGLMNTTAQILAGLKTFASAAAGAADYGVKMGTSVADASVTNGFKFASFASGIGGTEAEWARFTRPVGYGGSVLRLLNPASQVNTFQLAMDGCMGVGGIVSYGNLNQGSVELHGGQADSYLQVTNRGLTIRQNSNSYDSSRLMHFVVDQTGSVASTVPVFDFVATTLPQSGQKLMRLRANSADVAWFDRDGGLAVSGYVNSLISCNGSRVDIGNNGAIPARSAYFVGINTSTAFYASGNGAFSSVAGLRLWSETLGANSGEVVAKIGTYIADGSVHAAAKLFSVRTGLGGTEVEKLHVVKDGTLELTGSGVGFVLASPDGTRYRITVANGGTLNVAAA